MEINHKEYIKAHWLVSISTKYKTTICGERLDASSLQLAAVSLVSSLIIAAFGGFFFLVQELYDIMALKYILGGTP